jgi:uncharacterized protein (DUF58 family)
VSIQAGSGSRSWTQTLLDAWQQRFSGWVLRRIPPARNVVLGHENIFIIPNQQGAGFAFVLLLMFIGAVNYEASLGFALVFLLLGMFVLSIFYTFRNLSGLHVTATPGNSVFAGEKAEVTVILNRHGRRIYENIRVSFVGSREVATDLVTEMEQRITVFVPANRRGYFSPGRLRIETTFPFGISRAWSLVDLDFRCLVYPQPVECDLDWLLNSHQQSGNTNIVRGNDDFYGLRNYVAGDSLKHVAWKVLARGQGMFTKEYSSNRDDKVWLRWDMFPDLDTEQRLSRLCWCVLQLDSAGIDYGLELPGMVLQPSRGTVQYTRALRELALFGLPR